MHNLCGKVNSALGVKTDTFHWQPNVDNALQYFTFFWFDFVQYLIVEYDLFVQGNEWDELINSFGQGQALLRVSSPSNQCLR